MESVKSNSFSVDELLIHMKTVIGLGGITSLTQRVSRMMPGMDAAKLSAAAADPLGDPEVRLPTPGVRHKLRN